MLITTGNYMLNFGYWSNETRTPYEAQKNLCKLIGEVAELEKAENLIDVGSGLSSPAIFWKQIYNLFDIYCVNINLNHLIFANRLKENFFLKENLKGKNNISLINSTANKLTFKKASIDRIIALESAQHFTPLIEFISDCRYILKNNGILVIAVPVVTNSLKSGINSLKLGLLSFTWTSEHYLLNYILNILKSQQFKIMEIQNIGSLVYSPLSNYYIENRNQFKTKISSEYSSIFEYILYKSLLKMDKLSKNNLIDYIIIKSKKIWE